MKAVLSGILVATIGLGGMQAQTNNTVLPSQKAKELFKERKERPSLKMERGQKHLNTKALATKQNSLNLIAATTTPNYPADTMYYDMWNGSNWDEVYTIDIDINVGSGMVSSATYYIDLGGTSTPIQKVDFMMDGQGRYTNITISEHDGTNFNLESRERIAYTPQGHTRLFAEEIYDNGSWVMVYGDSLHYTYNAQNQVTNLKVYAFDGSSWDQDLELSDITYTNNEPTSLTFTEYYNGQVDEMGRYSGMKWFDGFPGWNSLFDYSEIYIRQLHPYTNPFPVNNSTDFFVFSEALYEENVGSPGSPVWEDSFRLTETRTGGTVTSIMEEDWWQGAWEAYANYVFSYNGQNITSIVEQEDVNGNWEDYFLYGFSYDSKDNYNGMVVAMNNNSVWDTTFGDQYLTVYNNKDLLDERILMYHMGNGWDNNERLRFVYAQNVSVPELRKQQMVAYPNPVREALSFELPEGEYFVQVTAMDGTVAMRQPYSHTIGNKLDMSQLRSGIYQVEITGKGEVFTARILKQ